MKTTRVMVVNELRSYREALAYAICNLRPDVDAFAIEPEDLDREMTRLCPNLVICSSAPPSGLLAGPHLG